MASVTFPTALGGDGKTYSDDADPDTGLDGLGYITRLVPLFKNGLAMAGYTAQYAARIDAAAANADRAEDAKQYVEAVAESYRVNLLDAYRDRVTLGADFRAGRYTRDDGARLDTNDPFQFFTSPRTTPQLSSSPSGELISYGTDVVARMWDNSKPQGVFMDNPNNSVLWSDDFSNSYWTKSSQLTLSTNGENNLRGAPCALVSSAPDVAWIRRNVEITNKIVSVFYKRGDGGTEVELLTSDGGLTFNTETGEVSDDKTPGIPTLDLSKTRVTKFGRGYWRVEAFVASATWFEPARVRSGSPVYVFGAQISDQWCSYMPTTDSPVSGSRSNLRATVPRTLQGTAFIEFSTMQRLTGNAAAVDLGDLTSGNRLQIGRSAVGNGYIVATSSGVSQISTFSNMPWPESKRAKAAASFRDGRMVLAWCGEIVHVVDEYVVPVMTSLQLGLGSGGGNPLGGYIYNFFLLNDVLSDAELEELTAL